MRVSASAGLRGEIQVPGDKSISHRAIILGAIANGTTEVSGFLFGEDNIATLKAFQQLGVTINSDQRNHRVSIEGVGLAGLTPSSEPLDMGNSGTAMRLMCGLLAGQTFSSTLIGDTSLSQRPMQRIVTPLQQMGAQITLTNNHTAPITIHPTGSLTAINYHLPMVSAQVKSALLLAGMYANGETTLTLPGVARDHSERMLQAFGYPLTISANSVRLLGGKSLRATQIDIPADMSSAAFFMVAASVVPHSDVTLLNVGINPTRVGIINILRLMGADIVLQNKRFLGCEPVADIQVRSAHLHGIDIPTVQVPLAIDEMPVLMIAAACATGVTHFRDVQELRVKETDRILAMQQGLQRLGIRCEAQSDSISINGGQLRGATLESCGDHRIAMAFAVAGCVASSALTIKNCYPIQTSFPQFAQQAKTLGFCID